MDSDGVEVRFAGPRNCHRYSSLIVRENVVTSERLTVAGAARVLDGGDLLPALAGEIRVFDGASEGLLAEATVSDVFSLVARFEGADETPTDASLREADRDLRALERHGVRIVSADWRLAAEVTAAGDISLADAYAVALAHEHDATLVARGDGDFDDLPVAIDVDRFRDHGV